MVRGDAGNADAAESVEDLLGKLTLEEKCDLMVGHDMWHTRSVKRLGLRGLLMTDGPTGARGTQFADPVGSAVFPCGAALASTFDEGLMYRIGEALGDEARRKGADVLLGPTVNLIRVPLGGRSFECFGEDPYHSARMGVAYIKGVQSRGVSAVVKHLTANEQEEHRFNVNVQVDERTLRELYLPPYEAAVKEAKVAGVMSGYSRLNGVYCSENEWLLQKVLRDEWGFEGWVVSDWFATKSSVASVKAGLNFEMPGIMPLNYGPELVDAVRKNEVSEEVVNERCRPVLKAVLRDRGGLVKADAACLSDPPGPNSEKLNALLREAAAKACVVLKNDGDALPMRLNSPGAHSRTIAVIGDCAQNHTIQGGGSARAIPVSGACKSILESIREKAEPKGWRVEFCKGSECRKKGFKEFMEPGNVFCNSGGTQYQRPLIAGLVDRVLSVVSCLTRNGTTRGIMRPLARKLKAYLLKDAGDLPDKNGFPRMGPAHSWAGEALHHNQQFTTDADGSIRNAVRVAAAADLCVVVVGTDGVQESEGYDQSGFRLPGGQDELVSKVVTERHGLPTVVVLNCGSPKDISAWLTQTPGVLLTWFGGQQMGPAVADVLFGDVEPEGRLATTWPRRIADNPGVRAGYPGDIKNNAKYTEGLNMGYRAFRPGPTHNTNEWARSVITIGLGGPQSTPPDPQFHFGFGLSYSGRFEYSDLTLERVTPPAGEASPCVRGSVKISNPGQRKGTELVQVYVRDVECSVNRPYLELKAFSKVVVEAGKTATCEFMLDSRAFAFYLPEDEASAPKLPGAPEGVSRKGAWKVEHGEFEVCVGAAANDIRCKKGFTFSG